MLPSYLGQMRATACRFFKNLYYYMDYSYHMKPNQVVFDECSAIQRCCFFFGMCFRDLYRLCKWLSALFVYTESKKEYKMWCLMLLDMEMMSKVWPFGTSLRVYSNCCVEGWRLFPGAEDLLCWRMEVVPWCRGSAGSSGSFQLLCHTPPSLSPSSNEWLC